MKKTFDISVNNEHQFSVSGEDLEQLDALQTGEKDYHVISGHKAFPASIIQKDFLGKKYTVRISGNDYKVKITDDLDRLIKEMGFETGAGAKVNEIFSPMPGLIFDLMVKEGDEVTEDQPLMILEAMKMENVISSPRDGKIKKIAVEKGQAIEKKALLIEFE